ncbi:MAG: hypothetical protein CMQ14_12460 [Gammaproteobacteria bacterium]|jgi:hypothetical protein|nr:hypothetical protein [Gammaproteobacteria bacterium]
MIVKRIKNTCFMNALYSSVLIYVVEGSTTVGVLLLNPGRRLDCPHITAGKRLLQAAAGIRVLVLSG